MKHPAIKITKNFFEKKAWAEGLYTCGIDEVGRGCLAGPVVVSAVIIPPNTTYPLLKDSKILTAEEREKAYNWIIKHCVWTTATLSHRSVDTHNIYQTTLLAMKKSYLQIIEIFPLPLPNLKYVLIDAMPLKIESTYRHEQLEVHHFNYGERFSTSIAAASIVAKVTRDRLMETISSSFPGFTFEQHKGYATKQHIHALRTHGATVIHRTTFIDQINKLEEYEQTSLFC